MRRLNLVLAGIIAAVCFIGISCTAGSGTNGAVNGVGISTTQPTTQSSVESTVDKGVNTLKIIVDNPATIAASSTLGPIGPVILYGVSGLLSLYTALKTKQTHAAVVSQAGP